MSMDEKPMAYRIDWRAHMNTHWLMQCETNSHDEALKLCAQQVTKHQGFSRVVVQHVIHTESVLRRKSRRKRAEVGVR